MPAGDASSALPPQDPSMGGAPMPDAPVAGGDPGLAPEGPEPEGGEATGKVKEIMDTANQISEKDQDTLLKYARSLKDASEEAGNEAGMPGGEPMPQQDPSMGGGQPPMMESVVFTKKQIRKLNENFGEMEQELDRKEEPKKTTRIKDNKVGPFDPPQKNIKR